VSKVLSKTNIHEVAEKAGVSIATVSRAFKPGGLVKEETKNKILQIARELDYKPSPLARGLSTQTTDTIGVILPELVGEFFMEIIHGIDEALNAAGKYMLVSSSHSQRNTVETVIEFMTSGRVDGVLLMDPQIPQEIAETIKKSKRPVVLINTLQETSGIANFRIDNYQGAYSNVEHLAGHGYKHIAIVKGPSGNCEAQERYAGYTDALKTAGLPVDSSLCIDGDFSIKSGYYAFMRLMSLKHKPDAIFFSNDMMALGAYDAAKNSNIHIPRDVAITGFDDIFLSSLLSPRLTTIHVPIAELGNRAALYLLKLIEGNPDNEAGHSEMLSTGLVVGESCGCKINSNISLLEI
jgi:LacI family transcriptional regulator